MSEKYIIVLGGTKCGTSSLFRYLGDHPAITPSLQKQTDFFLNPFDINDGAEVSRKQIDAQFKKKFAKPRDPDTACYLDVSPDYFCSQVALENLQRFAASKRCTFFVVLRNPIERLMSWYRFGQLIDLVPKNMSFGDFVKNQDAESDNAAFQAMGTGRFVPFLDDWMKRFPDNNLHYLHFDRLSADPKSLMVSMSETVGIDSRFYETYSFDTHNKTQAAKWQWLQTAYVKFQVAIKKLVLRNDLVNNLAEPAFRVGARAYRRFNMRAPTSVVVDGQLKEKLRVYYSREIDFLQRT